MPAQYPNDLNSIYSGGSIAAINGTLQQQANAEAQDRLDQQRQTLANQFTEQANPIKLQQEQANLEQTLAQNPGVAADSRRKVVEAGTAEATQSSDIKAKLSKNLAGMSDDRVKQLGNMGQSMIHMADLVDGGQQVPLDVQQSLPPEIIQALSTPEGRQKLRKRGRQMALDTSEHIRAKELEQMRLDVTQSEGKANRQTQWDIANLRFSTMLELASKKADKATQDKDFKAASIHWDNIADQLEQQGDARATQARERAAYYAKLATTAPVNQAGIDTSAAANTGTIQAPPSPATGAPSVGAPLAKPAEVQLPGGITVRVKNSHP